VLRGWGEELLRRDNVDKRKRKKRLIRLQVHPYRNSLTGLITPVRKNLQGSTCKCWTATRYGELYIHVESINLTHERISVSVHFRANSWRQRWSKAEAVDLVASHLRRGEWASLLTMWLGDGQAERRKVLI
jgi:hypothetical protein